MGVAVAVNEQTSEMVRLVDGKLVKETQQRNLYVVPPMGEYEWEITGYSLPFQMRKNPSFVKPGESEFQTKVRIEFTIRGGKGDGRMFTDMYTLSLGQQATFGKLLRALNVDLSSPNGSWDLDMCIGYRGRSYVTHGKDANGAIKVGDDKKPLYAQVVIETVQPVAAPERPYSFNETLSATPAPAPASSASDDDWPND